MSRNAVSRNGCGGIRYLLMVGVFFLMTATVATVPDSADLTAPAARNASLRVAHFGPPPRFIVQAQESEPGKLKHMVELHAPAAAQHVEYPFGSTEGVFGEGFGNMLGMMFLSNAALTMKPPILPTVPMLPGLPGMSSRNTMNPFGPIQQVAMEVCCS